LLEDERFRRTFLIALRDLAQADDVAVDAVASLGELHGSIEDGDLLELFRLIEVDRGGRWFVC
jgi:hypothetical protein